MLRQTSTLLAATEVAPAEGIARASGAPASRRSVVAAALLSLVLGLALWVSFADGRSALLGAESSAQAGRKHLRTGLSSLTPAAQASVSASLGEADPAYRVEPSPGGFRAATRGQRLHVFFGGSGVRLTSGALQIGLSLRAAGFGDTLRPQPIVAPRARANRVVYSYPGLSEWYTNGPFGLEQGFSIWHPPPDTAGGPVTLSMKLSGNARASLAAGGSSVLLSATGSPTLRYGGLVATDSRGRTLPSWLELHGGKVLLRVDVRGARYPLRVDPFIQQAKLTASGTSGAAQLGAGVAISPDGNIALIGAPEDNGGAGAAWVFTRSGSTWTQQGAKLTGAGESGPGRFGTSVALSSNGDTALIGAPANAGGGGAWVFTRSGSTWTPQGELTGAGASGNAHFGNSVALSSDGSTALIGGPEDEGRLGGAWVFVQAGSTWTQQGAKLTGGEEADTGYFGDSVALSSNGSTALIGGPEDSGFTGAAWVFTRAGSSWTQEGAKLAGRGEVGGGAFGSSVALSGDGATALIGGLADSFAGAAWVFTRAGSTWTQQGSKLTSGAVDAKGNAGEPLGAFGAGVALSGDGNAALIGGPGERVSSGGSPFVGSAWLFRRSGGAWSAGSRLTGGEENGPGDFGYSVALSASGGTAVIGGPEDSTKLGAAWAFVNPEAATRGELTGISSSQGPGANSKLGAPVITDARQSRNRWRERDQVAHISRAEARLFVAAAGAGSSPFTHTSRRGKYRVFYYNGLTGHEYSKPTKGGVGPRHNIVMVIPAGTTFSFTLNVQAAVSFTFTQNLTGRKLRGKCVALANGIRTQPACTHAVTRGTLSLAGNRGRNTVPFQGLIPGSRKLPPGTYTLMIRAINAAGRARPKSLRFTIFG